MKRLILYWVVMGLLIVVALFIGALIGITVFPEDSPLVMPSALLFGGIAVSFKGKIKHWLKADD